MKESAPDMPEENPQISRHILLRTREMIEYGDDDFESARDAVREEGHVRPRKACTEAHGAAERYLKAFLLFNKRTYRRFGHDLSRIIQACIEIDSEFDTLADNAKFLDKYRNEMKYPPPQPYSIAVPESIAVEAVDHLREIKDFVLKKIQAHGYLEPDKPASKNL